MKPIGNPDDLEDEQWLDALAGSPRAEAATSLNQDAATMRKALAARSELLDRSVPKADEALYHKVQKAVASATNDKRNSRSRSWRRTIAFAIGSFLIGLAVARVTMMPTLQATRSAGPQYSKQTPTSTVPPTSREVNVPLRPPAQIVSIRVADPLETVRLVSKEAIDLGLPLSVSKHNSMYRLYIDGLIPESLAQARIKSALGLSDSVSGPLEFIVMRKD